MPKCEKFDIDWAHAWTPLARRRISSRILKLPGFFRLAQIERGAGDVGDCDVMNKRLDLRLGKIFGAACGRSVIFLAYLPTCLYQGSLGRVYSLMFHISKVAFLFIFYFLSTKLLTVCEFLVHLP